MRKILPLVFVTLMASTVFAAGEIYRWKDSNGLWHYSDQPQPGAELVRTARRPAAAATPAARTAPTGNSGGNRVLPVSNEVAQQVRQEAAAVKAEQCKKAEEVLARSMQARRIFKTDENGNRSYLSDAEVDAQRLEARGNRDLACGP
jgi:hypothetical protein